MANRRIWLIPLATLLLAALACASPTSPAEPVVERVEVTVEVPVETIITATPVPEVPVPAADPIFTEDFEGGAGDWSVGESDTSNAYVENGQLIIDVIEPLWVRTVSHPALDRLETYAMEFDMNYVGGANDVEGGLAFRCEDEDDLESEWLEMSVAQDGYITVAAIPVDTEADVTYPVNFTALDVVNTGSAVNHVRVLDDRTRITIYLNDELVAVLPYDDAPPGCPALLAGTFEGGQGSWAFDNIAVYNLADVVGP